MSTDKTTPLITTLKDADESPESVEKKNFATKAKTFITKHKKPLIAAALLGTVVGVASLSGRGSNLSTDFPELELDAPEDVVYEGEIVEDTVVA